MIKTAVKCLILSLWFIALIASTAAAQVATADVVGRVTDASGATILGARVTIENLGTLITRSTLTSASGDYAINLLSPGHYAFRIEISGFKAYAVSDLALAAGDRARIDAQMQIGLAYYRPNIMATVVCAGTGSPLSSVGLYCHCFTASMAASSRIGLFPSIPLNS
jgi:hypothetical protein